MRELTSSNFVDQTDPQAILALADEFSEDEFGNSVHIFDTAAAKVVLERNWYDGDTRICLIVPGQAVPLVNIELLGCNAIRAVDDKRGRYLEFVGQVRTDQVTRGVTASTLGLRIFLAPVVTVEPFFIKETQ